MLEVFTKDRKKLAILQNAFSIKEKHKINALSYLDFKLPTNDIKNKFCQYRNLVTIDGRVYRIMSSETDTGSFSIHYTCESILAKLIDHVLYGTHVIGNRGVYTDEVIQYVLKDEPDFVLDKCEFARQFEYGWEQESKLSALLSIPKPFTEKYKWECDTSTYPYKLSLKRLNEDARPKAYLRDRLNLLKVVKHSDSTKIVTKIYPLGVGEGINQLTIKDVNGGVPYLMAPQKYIDKYGVVETVWIDRRYNNAESLKAMAQKMLDELQEPYTEYQVNYARLKGEGKILPGDVIKIIDEENDIQYKTFVTEVTIDYENIEKTKINIANKPQDIATSVADLADRQRIEQAYSQGATQLYSQSLQGNADKDNGLLLDFFIPEQAVFINSIKLKTRMSSFRAYSKATEAGGSVSTTSSSGGGSTVTSNSGGSEAITSDAAGNASVTSASGGGIKTSTSSSWGLSSLTRENVNLSEAGKHVHSYDLITHVHDIKTEPHTHTVSIPSHKHTVKIPAHTHKVEIPEHTHDFEIPEHSHDIDAGIYFFGSPTYFDIYVNGTKIETINGSDAELDITNYLISKDQRIPRNQWLTVEVRPNDLAYISISLAFQGYIQSKGQYNV